MKNTLWAMPLLFTSLFWAASAVAADQRSQSAPSSNTSASSGVLPEVPVRDLNRHPDRFAGHPVAVSGKIDRIEGPNAFVLSGSGLLNNKILVVVDNSQQAGTAGSQSGQSAGTAAPTIKEKQKVQLMGKLEELGVTRIEEKYRPNLSDEVKAEFEGMQPVLVVSPNGIKSQG